MRCMLTKVAKVLLVPLCVFAFCQCSDDPLDPFQPEVNSTTDSFQLQATGVTNRSVTLTYSWENTGAQAKINHSTTTTDGSARVVIKETGGAVVYDEILVPSLSDTTTAGAPGAWTIYLVLNQYSGTLNFRAEKL